jgi:hypothetical protein
MFRYCKNETLMRSDVFDSLPDGRARVGESQLATKSSDDAQSRTLEFL